MAFAIRKMDLNNDGILTKNELAQSAKQFLQNAQKFTSAVSFANIQPTKENLAKPTTLVSERNNIQGASIG